MGYLEEITKKVHQKLNLKHKDIILSYYQQLINKHNEFCGCNYCNILEKYKFLKIYKTKIERRYNNYDGWDPYLERQYLINYRSLEIEIKQLKLEKNKLKQL